MEYGQRYTLALTWIRRHESKVTVLRRLMARIREIGLKIKRLLLDREFFNVPVVGFLQQEKLPFLMPVVIRGRKPRLCRPATGLRWIKQQPAGWYPHTMKNGKQEVTLSVCVNYRTHKNRKDRKQVKQKLLFAAWGSEDALPPTSALSIAPGSASKRVTARCVKLAIYTCTCIPRLRLLFVAVSPVLRNMWVWIHQTLLSEEGRDNPTMRLERLRFKRMLEWIVHEVLA